MDFQYDRECNLLFIFGCDQEAQNGGFDNPNAIECLDNYVYILDGRNDDITVFEETLFGAYVHEAAELFKAAEDNAKWRYNNYRRLAKQQWGVEQED